MGWRPANLNEVMEQVIKWYLSKEALGYVRRRLGNRSLPHLLNFWIDGEAIERDLKMHDGLSLVVELLSIALRFVGKSDNLDATWTLLRHIDEDLISVERKIKALEPGLKDFVFKRKQGEGPSAADFSRCVLPAFKALIREITPRH